MTRRLAIARLVRLTNRMAAMTTCGLILFLAPETARGTGSQPDRLTFDTIFGEGSGGQSPRQMSWAPDGRRLAYLWKQNDKDGLWILDVESGKKSRFVSIGNDDGEGDLVAIDSSASMHPGNKAFHWSPDGQSMLFLSRDDLYLLELPDKNLRRLTETKAKEQDPKFSPDGKSIAFVRDFDLHLLDIKTGHERELTTGGSANEILNGITDWVYWEEIWGRASTAFWWSPSGREIAYLQFDERSVKSYPLVDFTHQYPEVSWQKYPKAGETNPLVRVGVLSLEGDKTTWMNTGQGTDVYMARVDWRSAGDRVAIQRLNRGQDRLDLLLCDPHNGACSTLLTERAETWVNVHDDLRFLNDNSFLWASERSGWNHLYHYSAEGELIRRVTPDGWTVTLLDKVVDRDKAVIFTAYPTETLGALQRGVFRQELAGGDPEPISFETGWSGATVSTSANAVLTTSTANEPARSVVIGADGTQIAKLPGTQPATYDPRKLPAWDFLTIPGPGRNELPAALLKPEEFDPSQKYPAVMYHYGGPASQVVADRWTGSRNLWHKMMAQHGYVVLMVDNQASNFFGKHGADLLHRRFGERNLEAQLAGVAYLSDLGYVDPSRIGLWGWSGGGANTLYSLLNSPGTWKAGVSGAPVTSWRFYDSIWTERYLDHPEENPDGYQDSSAITYAAELQDELLIVHGTADDNVHPQNTIAMLRKLLDAGVPFENAIYPRQKHGFRGGDSRHFYERMTEFFDRHLRSEEINTPAVDGRLKPQL